MVRINKDRPDEQTRLRHIDFTKINWDLLCAIYFAGYLLKGKGMVVAFDEDYINKPKGILTNLRICFIPASELTLQKIIGDKERSWMEEIEPEKTLLVGFIRLDGGFSSYRLESFGDNTPAEIFKRSKPPG